MSSHSSILSSILSLISSRVLFKAVLDREGGGSVREVNNNINKRYLFKVNLINYKQLSSQRL